jgi:hypothetical protein
MTRNTLMGGVLAGLLFLSTLALALADDPPKDSGTASNEPTGSVEASKQTRVYRGGVSLTSGYNRFSGPAYGGTPFYGYYSSQFWTPFWPSHSPYDGLAASGFYPAQNLQRGPSMGEIKLQAEPMTASVFINDAYAGQVQDLRSISLEPGVYNLRIEAEGRPNFACRVYVLSGKTLKIEANLMALKGEQP